LNLHMLLLAMELLADLPILQLQLAEDQLVVMGLVELVDIIQLQSILLHQLKLLIVMVILILQQFLDFQLALI
jgi:hypothetical protein